MLSETLATGLEAYGIGARIRVLRQKKELSLVQLGEHTGISPGMLSKIERGQLFPTLPTLLRIAMVFGVGLEHFFIPPADRPTLAIVRKKDRVRLPDRPGEGSPSYFFESLDFPVPDRRMEAFYAEFEQSSEASAQHSHPGAEVIFVISGELVLNVDGEEAVLEQGDSIYFDSGFPHSYRRQGRASCSAIVVVSTDKR